MTVLTVPMPTIMKYLNYFGICHLPPGLDVASFNEHLSKCPVYENHVRQGKPNPVALGSHPWTCHDMWDVIEAPDFLEAAILMLPVASEYLGVPALLYSLNAFYCEPNASPKPDIQDWHRDTDDTKFLALFMYGTDVSDGYAGPHQFHCGTQGGRAPEDGRIETVLGPAGTMFLADTSALHRGVVPQFKRRMMAWARFGVSDPPAAYQWDGLKPYPWERFVDKYPDRAASIATDPATRHAIHLILS